MMAKLLSYINITVECRHRLTRAFIRENDKVLCGRVSVNFRNV